MADGDGTQQPTQDDMEKGFLAKIKGVVGEVLDERIEKAKKDNPTSTSRGTSTGSLPGVIAKILGGPFEPKG